MGSRIGLRARGQDGDRFDRAVLGGLGKGGGFARAEAIARRMRGDTRERDPVAVSFQQFAAARPGNDLEALAACILGPQSPLQEAELRAVRSPVLVVAGENDELAPDAGELAAALPRGEFLQLPGRNHMNAVPARQFKEAALEFLG